MTQEETDFEKSWNFKMVKKFTKSIFTFDLSRFSIPVAYSEQRSFLERTVDLLSFLAQRYLQQAAATSDPVNRIRNVAVGIIAGFHLSMQSKKPFNPHLGETLMSQWPNGVQVFGEQISHHPALSAFEMRPPDNSWRLHSVTKFGVQSGVTEFVIKQRGIFAVEFSDGGHIEWEYPDISAIGILVGDRIVRIKGDFVLRDTVNNIQCEVFTNPMKDKKKGIEAGRMTRIYGEIKRIGEKETIDSFIGDYCESIKHGDEVLWDINTFIVPKPDLAADPTMILPSDCRYRLDRNCLINDTLEEADEVKIALEEAQRRDAKLRNEKD